MLGIESTKTLFDDFQATQPEVCACCQRFKAHSTRMGPFHRLSPLPVRLFAVRYAKVVRTDELCGHCRLDAEDYFCVSHVWGEITDFEDISAYGCTWKAPVCTPTKIADLLPQIQQALPWCRWLWMDVLCIDQSADSTDAESQVGAMRWYYRNGGGTIAIMSSDAGQKSLRHMKVLSDLCAEGLRKWGGGHNGRSHETRHHEKVLVECFDGEVGKERMQACIDFMKDPWLQRVWTLQEFVLPLKLYYLSVYTPDGQSEPICEAINNLDVRDAFEVWRKGTMSTIAWPNGFEDDVWSRSHGFMGCQLMRQMDDVSACAALYYTKGRACSREQDRIYGILGLLSEVSEFPVSYADPLDVIYRRLLSHISPQTALSLMRTPGSHCKEPGFTWAPASMDEWIVTDDELTMLVETEMGDPGLVLLDPKGWHGNVVFKENFWRSKAREDPDFDSWVIYQVGEAHAWVVEFEDMEGVEAVCLGAYDGDSGNAEEESTEEDWFLEASQRKEAYLEALESDQTLSLVSWVLTEGRDIPKNAIQGGSEGNGTPLYIARAFHQGGVHVGKMGSNLAGAHIAWGGWEIEKEKYEILCGDENAVRWVKRKGHLRIKDGMKPVGGGREGDGRPLYVGRATVEGGVHVGKAARHLGGVHIAYGGTEMEMDEYEVLCSVEENEDEASGNMETLEEVDGEGEEGEEGDEDGDEGSDEAAVEDDEDDADEDYESNQSTMDPTEPFPQAYTLSPKLLIWTCRKNGTDIMGGALLEAVDPDIPFDKSSQRRYRFLCSVIGSHKMCWERSTDLGVVVVV